MIDAGILDGDKIIVKKQDSASNNEIVVALLIDDNEATVKRIFYEDNHQIRLQPENKTMEPIFCDDKNVKILGKVTGLIRKY